MLMPVRPLRRLLTRPTIVSHFHTFPSRWSSPKKTLQQFKLADIGEGITECEVIKWTVKELATVQSFDPLCEVQSDKASVEITSPFDGVLKEILVKEGEIAKVGQGLCVIEVEVDEPEEVAVTLTGDGDGGNPELESSFTPSPTISDSTTQADQIRDEPTCAPRRLHPMDPNYLPCNVHPENALAKPSVRHYARQHQVDLALLPSGSGRDGRIEKKDIDAFLSRSVSKVPDSPIPRVQTDEDVIVELSRMRYGMWKAMTQSLEIPHFGYSTSLDLTSLHSLLPTLNAHIPEHFNPSKASPVPVNPSTPLVTPSAQFTRLTYLPFLLKTLSKAMMEWPIFRSSITPGSTNNTNKEEENQNQKQKPTLTIRPHADIAIALSTKTGLYTPVIPRAETQSVYGLASELKRLAELGRAVPCGLSLGEMPKRGGTVTVSNVGAIGDGEYAHPVLGPGCGVAIVAVGRARWVWDVSRVESGERRLKVGVSWSADHRVLEGAELAAFVECWRGYVEIPERLVGEGV